MFQYFFSIFFKILIDAEPAIGNPEKYKTENEIDNINHRRRHDETKLWIFQIVENLFGDKNEQIYVIENVDNSERFGVKEDKVKILSHPTDEDSPTKQDALKFVYKTEDQNRDGKRSTGGIQSVAKNPNAHKVQKASKIKRSEEKLFQSLITEVAQQESRESVLYDRIVESLIRFLKFLQNRHIKADFTLDQVIEMTSIFQRVIKIKTELLKRLFKIASNLRHSKSVQITEVNSATEQIACLQEFSACVNLEVISERLSSPKVRAEVQLTNLQKRGTCIDSNKTKNVFLYLQIEMVVDGIVYLLPHAKIYENELEACLKRNNFSIGKNTQQFEYGN